MCGCLNITSECRRRGVRCYVVSVYGYKIKYDNSRWCLIHILVCNDVLIDRRSCTVSSSIYCALLYMLLHYHVCVFIQKV